jgi:hypothetical protein
MIFSKCIILGLMVSSFSLTCAVDARNQGEVKPPPAAKENGLTRLAFHEEFNSEAGIDLKDTRKPGFSFYITRPFGWSPTSTEDIIVKDGVLHIEEDKSYSNFQLCSIGGRDDANSWIGFAASLKNGGAYFEVSIAFDPYFKDNNPDSKGFPAFWTMSAEHLYPHVPRPYDFFENDFFEYFPGWYEGKKDKYLHALHHWKALAPRDNTHTIYPNPHSARVINVPSQTNWNEFNVIGTLWVPGKTIKSYFNNELMRAVSYEDYPALSVSDQQHFPVILGSGQWHIRVDWVRVWLAESQK